MAQSSEHPDGARPGEAPQPEPDAGRLTVWGGLLLFVLGFALGVPLATVGWSFLAENADLVAAFVFVVIFTILAAAAVLFLYREWIWQRVFRTAEVQLQAFVDPLAELAQHAASSRATEAMDSARLLAHVFVARWAWLTTRRWIIVSITGLIAAIAALAGTALLFRQNELLGEQTIRFDRQNQLLEEQTTRLDQQNRLIGIELELADAQRASGLIAELSAIADGIEAATAAGGGGDPSALLIDAADLPASLRARIVAASIAARPYRFLDRAGESPLHEAMRRRPDLPRLAAAVAKLPAPASAGQLTARPVSPERGLLLLLLYHSRILQTASLHFLGADFSSAVLTDLMLAAPDYRHANLARADFSRSYINGAGFGGADLEGASFRDAVVRKSLFSALPGAEAVTPYRATEQPYQTRLTGTNFSRAFLDATGMDLIVGGFANFDGAFLNAVTFRQASLDGATFRNAVLLDIDFSGASIKSVDFDAAIVVGQDWLARLAEAVAPESFTPSRFTLEPVAEAEVRAMDVVYSHLGVEVPESALAGKPLFRVRRVAPFE